jgi:hypothetical protein
MRSIWAGLVATTAVCVVWGHDNATLDAMTAPHHGQLRMAGPYHLELVLGSAAVGRKTSVALYLTDHAGTPSVIQQADATLECKAGKAVTTVHLLQKSPNRFAGAGPISSSSEIECLVTLQMSDGTSWLAEFTPRAKRNQPST